MTQDHGQDLLCERMLFVHVEGSREITDAGMSDEAAHAPVLVVAELVAFLVRALPALDLDM